jgi:hypothetical protein
LQVVATCGHEELQNRLEPAGVNPSPETESRGYTGHDISALDRDASRGHFSAMEEPEP